MNTKKLFSIIDVYNQKIFELDKKIRILRFIRWLEIHRYLKINKNEKVSDKRAERTVHRLVEKYGVEGARLKLYLREVKKRMRKNKHGK